MRLKPSIEFICGCKIYEESDRAWTVYCKEHGKNSYPTQIKGKQNE